jgi:hypothetical protein
MHKINTKESCVISIYDELIKPEFHRADILLAVIAYKDKFGIKRYEQFLTSKIISREYQKDQLTISTLYGNYFTIDSKHDVVDLTVTDFVVDVSNQFSHEDRLKIILSETQ